MYIGFNSIISDGIEELIDTLKFLVKNHPYNIPGNFIGIDYSKYDLESNDTPILLKSELEFFIDKLKLKDVYIKDVSIKSNEITFSFLIKDQNIELKENVK